MNLTSAVSNIPKENPVMFTVLLVIMTVVVLLWSACQFHPGVRYYVRFGVFYSLMTVSAMVVLVLSIPTPNNVNNFRYLKLPFAFCRWLFSVEVELRGGENFEPWSKPYIIVSNHQASLDFLAISKFIPDRCTFVAKKELMYVGPFGLALWVCGCIFIDRVNHKSAISTMGDTGSTIKDKKIKVWIFPEGRRNPEKGILPFKRGAFHMAVQAQVPVVPVVLSHFDFLDQKRKHLENGKIYMTVLPPVPTTGLTGEDVNKLSEDVRNEMLKVFTAYPK